MPEGSAQAALGTPTNGAGDGVRMLRIVARLLGLHRPELTFEYVRPDSLPYGAEGVMNIDVGRPFARFPFLRDWWNELDVGESKVAGIGGEKKWSDAGDGGEDRKGSDE